MLLPRGEGGSGGKFLYNSAEVMSFQRKIIHLTITEHTNQQYTMNVLWHVNTV